MTDNETIKALEKALKVADETINRQQAEIERLRNTIKTDFLTVTEKLKLSQSEISEIKSEAIKEFAERLKLRFRNTVSCNYGAIHEAVNRIVKEMTEDEGK